MIALLVKLILESLDPVVDNSSIGFVMASDTATTTADADTVGADCAADFNFAGPMLAAPTGYLSNVISRAAGSATYEVYDITAHLDGTPHGSPVAMGHWTPNAPFGTHKDVPEGVAAACSYRAAYGTDPEFGTHARPRARDRNRFYWGPLTDLAIDDSGATRRARLSANLIGDLQNTLQLLSVGFVISTHTWNLRVWSRKNAGLKLPILGFMDDRPDYQRRRSDPSPGARTLIGLPS